MTTELNEPVLPDDYPVYWDYWYVADGKPIRSNVQGTVRELKADVKVSEIRRCDIAGRRRKAQN